MRTLIPWRRRNVLPLENLRFDFETLMDRFFGEPLEPNGHGSAATWAPRVDVEETEKEILVKVDVPGVDPKVVEVSVVEGTLVLSGEKKEEKEEKEKNYHRMERFTGQFYRAIPLPAGIDPDKIVATSNHGVIQICIPKKPEVLPKKIPVNVKE